MLKLIIFDSDWIHQTTLVIFCLNVILTVHHEAHHFEYCLDIVATEMLHYFICADREDHELCDSF